MDFQKFLLENKEKLVQNAKLNGKYNANGDYVVSSNDEWVREELWDEFYNDLKKGEE